MVMKTLAIFCPGCIEFEIMLACEILNGRFPVDIATPDGKDHVGSNGMVFKAAYSYANVISSEYIVVLVPGGNPDQVIENVELCELLRISSESGAILGAICSGPVLLDKASLLENRRIAHGYQASQKAFLSQHGFFKNTELTDETIVSDGNIVTARPDSFIDFAIEIAHLTRVISFDEASFLRLYYRGVPKPKQ